MYLCARAMPLGPTEIGENLSTRRAASDCFLLRAFPSTERIQGRGAFLVVVKIDGDLAAFDAAICGCRRPNRRGLILNVVRANTVRSSKIASDGVKMPEGGLF